MWTINYFKPIYQQLLESGKTVRQFCTEAEIHEERYYHWQNNLRLEVANGQNGELRPVSINNRSGKVVLIGGNSRQLNHSCIQQPTCGICFPDGVTVRINGNNPVR